MLIFYWSIIIIWYKNFQRQLYKIYPCQLGHNQSTKLLKFCPKLAGGHQNFITWYSDLVFGKLRFMDFKDYFYIYLDIIFFLFLDQRFCRSKNWKIRYLDQSRSRFYFRFKKSYKLAKITCSITGMYLTKLTIFELLSTLNKQK